jgi:hypothetical protein
VKVRINKQLLADMPPQVRNIVTNWKARHRKSFINVNEAKQILPPEDATVTMINLATGAQKEQRVAGEFAGFTHLSPTAIIPLPPGCVCVCHGFFLGVPWLSIYQNGGQIKTGPLKLSGIMVECDPPTRAGFGCNMDGGER